jgi:2-(1,2-epoxy-1,2-dihydrophenyl)acetyl-CoA isomerase
METGQYAGFATTLTDGGVLRMRFDRPDRMNGMSVTMKRDLIEQLTQAQMANEVRVVLFEGSGRAFCAGDDLRAYTDPAASGEAQMPAIHPGHDSGIGTYSALRTVSQRVNRAIRDLDKLTVAAINGIAIQTGFSLALACDFRIAAESARMGSATLRFALLPDEGGHYLLVQHLGVAGAMDFLMRKRIVDAARALELGLVHEVVEDDLLEAVALDLAEELAAGPQTAMRLLKRSLYAAADAQLAASFDDIAARTAVSDHHPDAREGVAAFREKRAPKFS